MIEQLGPPLPPQQTEVRQALSPAERRIQDAYQALYESNAALLDEFDPHDDQEPGSYPDESSDGYDTRGQQDLVIRPDYYEGEERLSADSRARDEMLGRLGIDQPGTVVIEYDSPTTVQRLCRVQRPGNAERPQDAVYALVVRAHTDDGEEAIQASLLTHREAVRQRDRLDELTRSRRLREQLVHDDILSREFLFSADLSADEMQRLLDAHITLSEDARFTSATEEAFAADRAALVRHTLPKTRVGEYVSDRLDLQGRAEEQYLSTIRKWLIGQNADAAMIQRVVDSERLARLQLLDRELKRRQRRVRAIGLVAVGAVGSAMAAAGATIGLVTGEYVGNSAYWGWGGALGGFGLGAGVEGVRQHVSRDKAAFAGSISEPIAAIEGPDAVSGREPDAVGLGMLYEQLSDEVRIAGAYMDEVRVYGNPIPGGMPRHLGSSLPAPHTRQAISSGPSEAVAPESGRKVDG